jgi:hypothetical protein
VNREWLHGQRRDGRFNSQQPEARSDLAPGKKAEQASSLFKPFKLLAICFTSVSPGILKQVQDDDVGNPFTVYRLSHRM